MNLDLNHFNQKLTAEKTEIETELARISRVNPLNPAGREITPTGETDGTEFRDEVADHLEEMAEREAVEEDLAGRLKSVNAALARLAAGTYGVCEIGGEPIEGERLEANPAARTCKQHLDQDAG